MVSTTERMASIISLLFGSSDPDACRGKDREDLAALWVVGVRQLGVGLEHAHVVGVSLILKLEEVLMDGVPFVWLVCQAMGRPKGRLGMPS